MRTQKAALGTAVALVVAFGMVGSLAAKKPAAAANPGGTPRYEGGTPQTETNLSGISGNSSAPEHSSKVLVVQNNTWGLQGSIGYLYAIEFSEKADRPIFIQGRGGFPIAFNGAPSTSDTFVTFGSKGTKSSTRSVRFRNDEAVNKLQVCINNGRIKGIRIWGGRFNSQGVFQQDHDAIYKEAKQPNCNNDNKWSTAVSCPAGQVAVGLRPAYTTNNGNGYFSGLGLICAPYRITKANLQPPVNPVNAAPVRP